MSLTCQTSNLTKQKTGGHTYPSGISFFFRILWIMIALIALGAVTIGSYQGTENLIDWYVQWGI